MLPQDAQDGPLRQRAIRPQLSPVPQLRNSGPDRRDSLSLLWMDAGFQNLLFLKSVTEKSAEGHVMLTDTFLPFSTRGLAKIGETEWGMPRATCPGPVVVPAWPSPRFSPPPPGEQRAGFSSVSPGP